jgi:hypothetical protein
VQQLEQLVELADIAADVAADVLAEFAVDVLAELAVDVAAELKAQVEIRQPEELKVLLIAICYWDSLKS